MSTEDSFEEALERIANRLVERGFATSYLRDDNTGFCRHEWTRSGKALRSSVRKVFGVPKVSPKDVTHDEVMALVGILIFDRD